MDVRSQGDPKICKYSFRCNEFANTDSPISAWFRPLWIVQMKHIEVNIPITKKGLKRRKTTATTKNRNF